MRPATVGTSRWRITDQASRQKIAPGCLRDLLGRTARDRPRMVAPVWALPSALPSPLPTEGRSSSSRNMTRAPCSGCTYRVPRRFRSSLETPLKLFDMTLSLAASKRGLLSIGVLLAGLMAISACGSSPTSAGVNNAPATAGGEVTTGEGVPVAYV